MVDKPAHASVLMRLTMAWSPISVVVATRICGKWITIRGSANRGLRQRRWVPLLLRGVLLSCGYCLNRREVHWRKGRCRVALSIVTRNRVGWRMVVACSPSDIALFLVIVFIVIPI